jgi:hypothetical protein
MSSIHYNAPIPPLAPPLAGLERKLDLNYNFKEDPSSVSKTVKKILHPLDNLFRQQNALKMKIQKMTDQKALILKSFKPSLKIPKDLSAEAKAKYIALSEEFATKRFALQDEDLKQELASVDSKIQELLGKARTSGLSFISRLPALVPVPTTGSLESFIQSYAASKIAAIMSDSFIQQEKASRPAAPPEVAVPADQMALSKLIDSKVKQALSKALKSKNSQGRGKSAAQAQGQGSPRKKKSPGKKKNPSQQKNKPKPQGPKPQGPKVASERSKSKQRKPSKKGQTPAQSRN